MSLKSIAQMIEQIYHESTFSSDAFHCEQHAYLQHIFHCTSVQTITLCDVPANHITQSTILFLFHLFKHDTLVFNSKHVMFHILFLSKKIVYLAVWWEKKRTFPYTVHSKKKRSKIGHYTVLIRRDFPYRFFTGVLPIF